MATATPPAPGSRTLNLLLRELTGARMLAISPRLVRALDSANAAVFLTYLLQVAPHAADDAGWFVVAKTRIEQETGLPDVCQDAALAQLPAAGILILYRRMTCSIPISASSQVKNEESPTHAFLTVLGASSSSMRRW